ncbi:LysM peptidoglycan-binding domain-containing protein [Tissierella sp. MB52-C2]|uniref:LysM peptidoglycan-binding domain-containing protein n=1 Tax=Tissierella sp. MB52-C2 TaxID=3070999 RepID=UPI00280BA631|nr:LysM peptidoglycan-binding domain-containing protein [Tissierella sp. MB52-C2]WMM26656.1 LysM peptidoglycan-binding domain-containing protein [Tissierella sp. MB52-C2]
MKLSPLKYKSYTWPVNPRTYSLRFEKNTAIHHYPYTNINEVDDTGMKPREVNGEGEFIGEGAYEEFQKLASIFYSRGPGSLIHPIWQIQQAIFTKLEVEQEPTPDYVKYSFSFIEHFPEVKVQEKKQVTSNTIAKPQQKVTPKAHTVKQGDTMWAIAKNNKINLKDLISKNPQIKSPNLIYPGQKINL